MSAVWWKGKLWKANWIPADEWGPVLLWLNKFKVSDMRYFYLEARFDGWCDG